MVSDYQRGISMAFLTALLLGVTGPLAKIISSTGLSQISVMCYRACFVVVIVGIWLCLKKGVSFILIPTAIAKQFLLIGVLGLVMNSSGFLMSAVLLTIPQALMIHFSYPIVTIVGSALFTKEKPTILQVMASFLIILGLKFGFSSGQTPMQPVSFVGIFWATISVFGVSGQMLLTRRLMMSDFNSPLLQLFFAHLFGGVILIIGKSLIMGWSDLKAITPTLFAIIQYPALGSSLLGFGLLYSALKYISASTASLICSLELVIGVLITPILLRQMPSINEMMGCAIVFFAVVISVFPENKTL